VDKIKRKLGITYLHPVAILLASVKFNTGDPPKSPLKSYALVTSFVTILKALFHKAFKKRNFQQS
jgi:hypothetical protein